MDVCEPYLRLFRRVIPPLGPLDISPIVAVFALYIAERIVNNVIGRVL
jgi:YggT family protein